MIRHKVFISYHHTEKDEFYKLEFERKTQDIIISQAVQFGDYSTDLSDEYVKRLIREDKISNSTVVIVLIGAETYKRKHVDWEIYAGLTDKAKGHSGLIGILLPTYYSSFENYNLAGKGFNKDTLPARFYDNLKTGYAKLYTWQEAFQRVNFRNYNIQNWIEDAFWRKDNQPDKINNSRLQLEYNLVF